jgi:hypothetical protein
MDYYSVISRFDPQRHEFYRYEFRWPARLQCTVRILMVTDGLGFGSEADLPRLVDAVTADAPYHVHVEVTTAHHAASGRTGADIDGFRFTTHGIEAYDQIWILGARSAPALSTTEVAALWAFMQGGGGLFVTGARDSGLSAGIPRVASMRGSAAPLSLDDAGLSLDGAGLSLDGAGGVVRPTMYPLNWQSIGFRHSVPHPIMCGRDGPITVLPDHAGMVEDPARVDLTARARVADTVVVEYPRCGTVRVPPQVIATGASPVDGSEFGVASAYDGHLVSEVPGGVGRVVVDTARRSARDLDRYAVPHDAVRAAITAGGTPPADQVALADHWRQLKDYYQNVAIWLARPATQQRIRQLGLLLAANHVDALMTWRPVEPESPVKRLPYLRDLGTRAQDAFHRIAPRHLRDAVTADVLHRLPIYAHLHPMPVLEPVAAPLWQLRLFDSALVEQVALGGAVDALHRAVSEREYMDVAGERLDRVARAGAEAALAVLVAELRAGVETMTALFHPADDPPDPCTAGPRTIVHSR